MSKELSHALPYPVLLNYETQSKAAADERDQEARAFFNIPFFSLFTQHGLADDASGARAERDNKGKSGPLPT